MRKCRAFVAVFLLLMLMTGCSFGSFDATTNTIYVKDDGTVMQAIIENFDESYYDEAELEGLIKQNVSEYNQGTDQVKVETYKVKDNKAKLITRYQSASDYAKFNEVEFFAGTISDAKSEDYDFDSSFTSIEEKKEVSSETIKSLSQYKVVIFKEDVEAKTDSKILYISDNLKLVDEKTAAFTEEEHGLGYLIYE